MYYLPVLLIIPLLMCKNYIPHHHPIPEQVTLERKQGSQDCQPIALLHMQSGGNTLVLPVLENEGKEIYMAGNELEIAVK